MKKILSPVRHGISVTADYTQYEYSYALRKYHPVNDSVMLINIESLRAVHETLRGRRTKSIPSGSRVYFSQSVTFSRLRFREWAKEKNISITRKIESADIIIVDLDLYNKVLKGHSKETIFFGYVGELAGAFHFVDYTEHSREMQKPGVRERFPDFPGEKHHTINRSLLTQQEMDALDQFALLPYVTGKIMSLEHLKKTIFDETLDGDTLEWINDMLGSGENDNIDLGVEMLGNFSFEGNEHVITDIFAKHKGPIERSHLASSVKFSHLRDTFNEFVRASYQCRYDIPFELKFKFFQDRNILHMISKEQMRAGLSELLQQQIMYLESNVDDILGEGVTRLSEISIEIDRGEGPEKYSFDIVRHND